MVRSYRCCTPPVLTPMAASNAASAAALFLRKEICCADGAMSRPRIQVASCTTNPRGPCTRNRVQARRTRPDRPLRFTFNLAERVGFEPTVPVKVRQFSRLEHSTALPPLLELKFTGYLPLREMS